MFGREEIDYPKAFKAGALHLGIKAREPDAAWLVSASPIAAAAVFSLNALRSASLDDAAWKLNKPIRGLGVFSGNANSCTGKTEKQTVQKMCLSLAKAAGLAESEVITSFTGVIGRPFPRQEISSKINALICAVQDRKAKPFSKGIWTTDTVSKKCSVSLRLQGREVRFAGCAKGSGMVYPNMATMLAYLTTDLKMKISDSKRLLKKAVNVSFNAISVDGDCSTNDSVFLLPNGASGVDWKYLSNAERQKVESITCELATRLAKEVVRDGEGATKLISVTVRGAKTEKEAKTCAAKISNSLLVKTAVFGNDPNYGRVLMAIGNAGVRFEKQRLTFSFGKIPLYQREKVLIKNLEQAEIYLKSNREIELNITVGSGKGTFTYYTCDISYDYVKINAEYTT